MKSMQRENIFETEITASDMGMPQRTQPDCKLTETIALGNAIKAAKHLNRNL